MLIRTWAGQRSPRVRGWIACGGQAAVLGPNLAIPAIALHHPARGAAEQTASRPAIVKGSALSQRFQLSRTSLTRFPLLVARRGLDNSTFAINAFKTPRPVKPPSRGVGALAGFTQIVCQVV